MLLRVTGPEKRHIGLALTTIIPTSFVCSLSGFFLNLGSDIGLPMRQKAFEPPNFDLIYLLILDGIQLCSAHRGEY